MKNFPVAFWNLWHEYFYNILVNNSHFRLEFYAFFFLFTVGDEVCIKELGCFKLTKDYYHPQYRPCNVLPEPRSVIYTRFVLFTRQNVYHGKFLDADNETSIKESGFNANHSTVFIVHGYEENPLYDPWILVSTNFVSIL